MFGLTLTLFVLVDAILANNLPSYITPCKTSDPNLIECAKKEANKAIPIISKGDKNLKLRVLDPLFIPEIKMDTSGNLNILLTDVNLYGLSNFKVNDAIFDNENQKIFLDLRTDKIVLIGHYNIDGKVLILPISGDGRINITLDHAKIGYGFNYDLVEKQGKKYMEPKPPSVTLDYERSYFDLENLFNGDKVLGEEMNKFLNENYDEMGKEFNPSVTKIIAVIASEIVDNMMAKVPFNEIFLD